MRIYLLKIGKVAIGIDDENEDLPKLPIESGDCPLRFVRLPEGIPANWHCSSHGRMVRPEHMLSDLSGNSGWIIHYNMIIHMFIYILSMYWILEHN